MSTLFSAIAALVLPLGYVAPKGEAVMFTAASIAALVILWRVGRLREAFASNRFVSGAFVLFGLLAFLSATWSVAPRGTLVGAALLAATAAGAVLLARAARTLDADGRAGVEKAVFYGGCVAFAWLAADMLSGGLIALAIRHLKGAPMLANDDPRMYLTNGASVAAVFLWAWLVAVVRRAGWGVGAAVLAGAFAIICFGRAATTPIAIAAGAVAAAATLFRPSQFRWLAIAAVVVGVMAAPVLPNLLPDPSLDAPVTRSIPNSGLHRLLIWRNAQGLILERPLTGYGFDSTRALYKPADKQHYLLGGGRLDVYSEPIPLHTHNAAIQVWLELGTLGGAALCLILVALIEAIFRGLRDPLSRASAMGAFATTLVIASLSYGAWQSWWLGGASVAVAVLAAVVDPRPSESSAVRSGRAR